MDKSLLVYIDFSQNALTGPIPTELGLLAELEYLELFENRLHGSIPTEIGLLTNLCKAKLKRSNSWSEFHGKKSGSGRKGTRGNAMSQSDRIRPTRPFAQSETSRKRSTSPRPKKAEFSD